MLRVILPERRLDHRRTGSPGILSTSASPARRPHLTSHPDANLGNRPPVATPITASIGNTQDYCVRTKVNDAFDNFLEDMPCVDGEPCRRVTPSTSVAYYDYKDDNNTATSGRPAPGPPARREPPARPRSLRVRQFGIIAIVSWDAMYPRECERLSGHPFPPGAQRRSSWSMTSRKACTWTCRETSTSRTGCGRSTSLASLGRGPSAPGRASGNWAPPTT